MRKVNAKGLCYSMEVAFIFSTAKAQDALHAGNSKQAEELANHSLLLRPDQLKTLEVLASAQFSQEIFRVRPKRSARFYR